MNLWPDSSPETTSELFTSGELLEDGSLLELVRLPSPTGDVGLLRAKNGTVVAIGPRLEIGGKVYRPMELAPGVSRAINLHTAPLHYGDTRDLFNRIVTFLGRFTGLTFPDLRLTAYFVLASWFADFGPGRLTLLVRSAFPAEVPSLLRSLRYLCRNGLLLGDLSARGFCSLPLGLTPTVIMDQTFLPRKLMGLLRVSNVDDLYVHDGGRLISPACFKVLCPKQEDLDLMFTQGTLRIVLGLRRDDTEILDERGIIQAQEQIQPRLLEYRLRNFPKVVAAIFDVADFMSPYREMARSLGAAIVEDDALRGEIVSLLRPQAEEARAQEMGTPECAITVAVLSCVHARGGKSIPVHKLCDAVNATLRSRGEIVEYSPVEIGCRLARLKLYTVRTADAKVLRLDRETSRKIHELARRFGVLPAGGFPGCPDCGGPAGCAENKPLLQGVPGV